MKSIIIVGAGVSGLSAGIYARKNGYSVAVYESHSLPGGMCTAWQRKGYTFDGSLGWLGLVGSSPKHAFYRMWKELGVAPGTKMVDRDILHAFADESGRTFHVYADADKLRKEMLFLSPQDAKEIKRLYAAIKRNTGFIRAAGMNPFKRAANLARILAALPGMGKFGAMTMGEYAAGYKDPLLRYAFENLFLSPEFSVAVALFFLAGAHIKALGWPSGGSLGVARALERALLDSGGTIEYRKAVKRVIVDDGRATGVELEDGTVHGADIVISAADARATLFTLLGDEHTPRETRERFEGHPVFMSFIQVSLGVNRAMEGLPHSMNVKTPVPFTIAGEARRQLWYFHYAFDPGMAPEGKNAITVLYPTDFSWWEKIGYRSEEYAAEKKRILDVTVEQLERTLPGISSQIEATDVATPYTTIRYTHNWKGALGFMPTGALAREIMLSPRYSLPGLEGFYMIGQWVKTMGVPMAGSCGKEVVQRICKADGRKFRA